jgi:hypothetical protein
MLKTALVKMLTVKAAAVAVVAVGGGGAALAAAGVLPNPLSAASGKPTAASAKPSHSAGPHGSPSPNLEGLCKAYAAKPDGERGKALESPAFQALLTAAGGQDKVTDYCMTLLPSAKPSSRPGGGKPSTAPGGAPSPRSKPTGHPGAPSTSPAHP